MKQLFQIFRFDVRMSFKNFMGAYMIIVPVIILIILRLFLPAVDSTTINFAIVDEGPNAVEEELIEELSIVGDISRFESVERMERKLRAVGIHEGLYWDPEENQYVSVLEETSEENQAFSYAARYIRQNYLHEHYPEIGRVTTYSYGVPEELSDRTKISPVATTGGAIFMIFLGLICAFLLGVGIAEDKDQGTILAMRVSPVSTRDYYIGRCIFPFIVTIFYAFICMLMLGLIGIDMLQLLVVVICSFSTTLVFGLFIGAMGGNQIEAIGIGKITSMVLMIAILGGTLLPESWHWVVYWIPVYWTLDALQDIYTETALWSAVIWKSALVMGISAVYFLLLRKKIIKGLS